jgi:hypothetical protein
VNTRTARYLVLPTLSVGLALIWAACTTNMTYREALEAMAASATSAKGEAMTQEIIEISTDFTIGEAVEDAAADLAAWLESQIECSTVTRAGHTVTVDFGTLADDCTYNGHTYAGQWAVSIHSNTEDEVYVEHAWTALTNGEVTLDGTADVTWSSAASSRRVVHDITWTDAEDSVDVTGDKTQVLLDPAAGIEAGIVVNGSRDWTAATGTWSLEIDAVEMRGQDPVPQAGSYALTTPDAKLAELVFTRLDEDTIECVLSAGTKSWTFEVSSSGQVSEE